MTDSDRRCASTGGFTLLELMAAMGILVFGLTALIGALGIGISQRRSAEMRTRAVLVTEQVLHRIETQILAETPAVPDEIDDNEALAIEPFEQRAVDGFPGIKYSVEFSTDPDLPELVLARIRVSWLEQGEDQAQVFLRVLPREVPFSQRVDTRRRP